ncbi:MAG: DNA alkylation repair protein [Rhodothermales bacterium]
MDVVTSAREALRANRDPEKAAPMQAYMKSEMPFLGIQAGPRRKICYAVFKRHPLEDAAAWIDATLTLADPAFVRSYVEANVERLSALSVKEALRRISDK